MKFYITDTTLRSPEEKFFNTYNEVVNYLDGMSQRVYHQNKKQRTLHLEGLGYGEDDRNSTLFVRSMADKFDMGTVRDGRKNRCDITTIVAYQKPEYGD